MKIFILPLFVLVLFLVCCDTKNNFVSNAAYEKKKKYLLEKAPKIIRYVRHFGIKEDESLKLKFVFYGRDKLKSEKLYEELSALGFTVGLGALSKENPYTIYGMTTDLKMDSATLTSWTREMCELGLRNDCLFNGWSVNTKQKLPIEGGELGAKQ